jgi:hypothetical protein
MVEPKIIKPIFIVGVPRSGTTMIYRILCLHPDLAWFSHEDLHFWIPKETQENLKTSFKKMKEDNKKIPKTEEYLFVFGPKQRNFVRDTNKLPIEAETLWQNYFGQDYITDVSEDKKNKIIQIIQKFLEQEKKNRFLNKSPANSMRIFALKKIFPDAKFINIGRDPRSVIASMLTRRESEGRFDIGIPLKIRNTWKSNFLIQKFLRNSNNDDVIKNYARSYQEITENINDFFKSNQENCFNIIYEELLEHPKNVILKLLEFCELEKLSDFNKLIPVIEETQNKWKEKLTKDDEKMIFKITESSMKKMSYPYKF